MGNGRQNHKFSGPKNRGGILLYCAGAGGNTCGRKSRGDEKQLINLEWPNSSWEYDRKPSLEENRGKIADFFGETRFEVKVKSPNPSQWNITVLSIADLVQLVIRK